MMLSGRFLLCEIGNDTEKAKQMSQATINRCKCSAK